MRRLGLSKYLKNDEVEKVLARLRPHIGKKPAWDAELAAIADNQMVLE